MEDIKEISETNSNQLNAIRICSAMMVMLGHGFSIFDLTLLQDNNIFPYIQNIGVVILFMLSGFLGVYSWERKEIVSDGQYSFTDYLINRGSRIIPTYIIALCIVIALDALFIKINPYNYQHYNAYNIRTVIINLMFLQDLPYINIGTSFGSGRPFWTLAIEWWIYIFFGYNFIYLYGKVKKKSRLTLKDLIMWIVFSIIPLYNLIGGRGNGLTAVWLLGGICYSAYRRVRITKIFSLIGICISVGWCLYVGWCTKEAYHLLFYLGVFLFLFFLLEFGKNGVSKKNNFLSFAAANTYCMYLIHYSIFEFLYYNMRGQSSLKKLSVGVVLSIIGTVSVYIAVERKRKMVETFCYNLREKICRIISESFVNKV